MRWRTPVLLAILVALAAGCAYHAPDDPSLIITLPPSAAPASIRLTGSSRSDRGVDVIATVLTATGGFVAGVNISLSTSAGSLSPASGVTDVNGGFRSILTIGGAAAVTAQVGTLTTTVTMLGSPD